LRAGVCAIIRLVVFCGITHGLQRGDYTASGCVMVCCVYASTTDALAWYGLVWLGCSERMSTVARKESKYCADTHV